MTVALRQHSESTAIKRGMSRCTNLSVEYATAVFRVCAMKFANGADLTSGEGARLHGGRWNPPYRFRAVYGTLDPHAALAETLGTFAAYQIPPEQQMPLVLVGFRIQLARVLDLTDSQVRRRLGISLKRIVNENWQAAQDAGVEGLTQAVGRIAFDAGIEALIVPSARAKFAKNVVVFPANLAAKSRLEIVNRQELPEPR